MYRRRDRASDEIGLLLAPRDMPSDPRRGDGHFCAQASTALHGSNTADCQVQWLPVKPYSAEPVRMSRQPAVTYSAHHIHTIRNQFSVPQLSTRFGQHTRSISLLHVREQMRSSVSPPDFRRKGTLHSPKHKERRSPIPAWRGVPRDRHCRHAHQAHLRQDFHSQHQSGFVSFHTRDVSGAAGLHGKAEPALHAHDFAERGRVGGGLGGKLLWIAWDFFGD
ncbi:hypothetical protein BKA63DRAFT_313065 [Paraphoma chrysanthemicola]|nr:hypothetical protein BKA63DRAFT_313065 [Paraphoma chrysanthemicola]